LLYKIFNLLVTPEEEGKFMRFLLPWCFVDVCI
jgi:hypothetical protein